MIVFEEYWQLDFITHILFIYPSLQLLHINTYILLCTCYNIKMGRLSIFQIPQCSFFFASPHKAGTQLKKNNARLQRSNGEKQANKRPIPKQKPCTDCQKSSFFLVVWPRNGSMSPLKMLGTPK